MLRWALIPCRAADCVRCLEFTPPNVLGVRLPRVLGWLRTLVRETAAAERERVFSEAPITRAESRCMPKCRPVFWRSVVHEEPTLVRVSVSALPFELRFEPDAVRARFNASAVTVAVRIPAAARELPRRVPRVF